MADNPLTSMLRRLGETQNLSPNKTVSGNPIVHQINPFSASAGAPAIPSRPQPMPQAEYASKHGALQDMKVTVARLGPMREKLIELGATPEQMAAMNPAQAYQFIKARGGFEGAKVSPGWQDRNQALLDRARGMQDELTGQWQAGKGPLPEE